MRPSLDEVVSPDMVPPARPQSDTRPVIQPQPTSLGLLGGYLQPLASPDAFDTLVVHMPALCSQQRRDPSITVAAILARQTDDRSQSAAPRHPPRWVDSVASSAAGREHGRHGVPRPDTSPARGPRICAGARGSEVSLRGLFEDQLVQCQIGNRSLETRILLLELLEPTGLVDLQPAVLTAPPVVCLPRNTNLATHLTDRPALRQKHIRFA